MSVARTETIFSCGQAPRTPCPAPPAIAALIVPCHSGSTSAPVPPSSAVAETSPGVVSGVALTPAVDETQCLRRGRRCWRVGEEHGVGRRRLAGDDRRRGAGDARGDASARAVSARPQANARAAAVAGGGEHQRTRVLLIGDVALRNDCVDGATARNAKLPPTTPSGALACFPCEVNVNRPDGVTCTAEPTAASPYRCAPDDDERPRCAERRDPEAAREVAASRVPARGRATSA